jgi:amino acid adenylation domain-containing protein
VRIPELLNTLGLAGIRLRKDGAELVVSGKMDTLAPTVLSALRVHKPAILDMIAEGGWWALPARITPEMLPLVELTQEEIDGIAARVDGGVRNVQDVYPLAPLQEGLLFHHLLAREGDPYLLPLLFEFENRELLDGWIDALQRVVERHDVLRTAIVWEGVREPVQVVWRAAPVGVEEVALEAAGDAETALWARFDPRRHRIDVQRAPMLRAYVAHDAERGRWLLLLLRHHLAGDHTATEVLREEIGAFMEGRAAELPAPLPFRNFVAQTRLGITREEHERFFGEMLGDVAEPAAPFGLLDAWGDGTPPEDEWMPVEPGLGTRLRECARRLGVSTASVCHVAWAQVLSRTSGKDDVVFGTVLFGRMQGGEGAHRVLGPFINTLPVRVRLGAEGAEAAVRRTHAALAGLLRHEHASLALAQRCSAVQAPAPLFTSLLNYRHGADARDAGRRAGWKGIRRVRAEERTNYPLTLSVDDLGARFRLQAQAPASVGAERVCALMHRALEGLVEALETAPERAVAEIDVLPPAERGRVVEEWNAAAAPFPAASAVHELFEAWAARAPDAVAVVEGEISVTYTELDERASRIARALIGRGAAPGDRVAILLPRSVDLVAAVLGVLKAGAAYVPLDPASPPARTALMLADSGAALVLGRAGEPLPVPAGIARIDVDALPAGDGGAVGVRAGGEAAACLMYTSGSTGEPKGVVVPHRAVVQLALANGFVELGCDDRVALAANPAFDASTLELWGPLLNGGRIVVATADVLLDPHAYGRLLVDQGVTTVLITPALFNGYAEAIPGALARVRHLLTGGDRALTAAYARVRAEGGGATVYNCYGPTETTCFSIAHVVSPEDLEEGRSVPIGRPRPNTRAYVLDAAGRPAPVGAAGELYLAGAGVARGYWRRAAATAERFVPDPFGREPGARLYRTGDLARWRMDGTLEFMGRGDHQVKIRGFRVEVDEVEARLAAHPAVREAAVAARDEAPGRKRLVAWFVGEAEPEALRAHLAERLPEYMLPAAYVRMEALPRTPSGKLDRRALPAPDAGAYARRGYEAPLGETETALAEIWSEVLGVGQVGRWDDFFELGGHSLLAVTLIERMRRRGMHADVRTLFDSPVLAELAAGVNGEPLEIAVPPNLVPPACERILPEMLPLVELEQEEIDRIAAGVPGGAANVQDIYPLAPLQEGILFHHLLDAGADPYVVSGVRLFDSRARLDAHLAALQAVIARHDVLRTAVVWEGVREPVQVVWRTAPLEIEEVELDAEGGDVAERLRARLDPRRDRVDVRRAPMMRACVARGEGGDGWALLLRVHHLAADHVTVAELYAEIRAHLEGRAGELPAPLPFRNLVAQVRLGGGAAGDEAFFRAMLAGVDEPTAPFGLLDTRGDGSATERGRMRVDEALAGRLRAHARRLGVSAASLFHVAWAQVLGRASGRGDVVFGTVLFGRMRGGEGADRAMGPFINTLPVRVRLAGESAEATVRRTYALLCDLLRHEHASLALAQRCSAVEAPAPLFTAALNYRYAPGTSGRRGDEAPRALEGTRMVGGWERTNYPFSLAVDDLGGGFALSALVPPAIGPERVCAMMHRALEGLAGALETAPGRAVAAIDVLPATERRQLVVEWNATASPYPREACVHALFEAQAERAPEAVAVVCGGESLSYAELNRRANRLAHQLRALGVGPEARVGVCMERSAELVVALLAVLKAGGAYLPLDPSYPSERLRYMLADSAPVAVLAQRALATAPAALLAEAGVPVIEVDGDGPASASGENPAHAGMSPEQLAYVIYTSGSTGRPKGVAVSHRAVVSRLAYAQRAWELRPGLAMLQKLSFSFDVSVREIFWPLVAGARLVVAPPGAERDPAKLLEMVHRERIHAIHFTPPMLQAVLRHSDPAACPSLALVLCGGEALPPGLVREFHERLPGAALHHMYGPTEATIAATGRRCAADEAGAGASIGTPVDNARVYVLDAAGEPVPVGATGEICIGGAGVARGYLGAARHTAARFVPDPFGGEPGARLYRSGDLGRWRADGTLEFQGRTDQQVKVRGFRIEPGEIEARLAAHPAVRETVVAARREEGGEARLVAYHVGGAVEVEALRAHLAAHLPEHMVPAAYVRLDALPLTPSGKLDRAALPAPGGEAFTRREWEAPEDETEAALAGIWAELLRVEQVGRRDHFFELGGHSLLAVQVVSRVRQVMGVELALPELFERPVLAELAREVARAARADLPPIEPADRGAPLPLSFAQQRLWFLEQLGGAGGTWHLRKRLRLTGELDRPALRRALDRIVARHEALRTTFPVAGGHAVQRIAPVEESAFHLLEHDIAGETDGDAALRRIAAEDAAMPFGLERGPLIRGRLVRTAAGEHVLFLALHHIVTDGWSMGVLVRELGTLYGAFSRGQPDPLAPLPVQYADYAAWQRRWIEGEVLRAQGDYWRRTLSGAPELLELPADRPRPARRDHAGGFVELRLSAELTAGLKALGRRHSTTLFTTLLAGWAAVMGRLSGQRDVVIGTPAANRGRREIEGLIGFFVNTLALRVDLSGAPTVAGLLARVKARAIEAQQHQDIPFEQVVEMVQPARSLAHTPLFQVMFSWQNAPRETLALDGLQLGGAGGGAEQAAAKYDLSLALREGGGGIVGGLTYASALFDRGTAQRFLGCFVRLLEEMVAGERQAVDRLELLTEAGRAQVVVEWNATAAPFPGDPCVHELFEARAAQSPDSAALVFGGESLGYGELNRRANRLAHHLGSMGVGPEDRVALCLEPSVEMVVGVLAVLKAGGAYLPLDPASPPERLRWMLRDAAPVAVLARRASAATFAGMDLPVLEMDGDAWAWAAAPDSNPPRAGLSPDHLAYVIYTSGSTGRPKGVMVPHRGVANAVQAYRSAYRIDASARVLLFAPLHFDASVLDLFTALASGAALVVGRREDLVPGDGLIALLRGQRVTHAKFTPSALLALPHAELPDLRAIISGGEACPAEVVRRWAPGRCFHNGYGPTETSVRVTEIETADATRPPPIGRPVANVRLYVLDALLQPVPVGVAGELHVGGVQVARGYLRRAALTAERFVPDPFGGEPGARLYRTGDLCRWLADGTIEFIGRNDAQVKVRGFRVEPGEVEAWLAGHPAVREAAVVAREDRAGDARLVAYYAAHAPVGADELRAYLRDRLPGHMVPAAYVALPALPVTPSGKLDRRALPAPDDGAYARRGYEAPVGETEAALAEVWAEVLGVERVGRRDGFFELGGHSLLAVTLIDRMRRRGLHADVGALFAAPVLAELAAALRAEAPEITIPANLVPAGCGRITPEMLPLVRLGQAEIDSVVAGVPGGAANVQDIYPLAPLQEGILFHHLMAAEGDPYLLALRAGFDTRERLDAYLDALRAVVARHDIMRTAIAWEGLPEPVQVVWRHAPLPVEEVRLDAGGGDAAEQLHRRFDPRHHRIDVRRAPLLRGYVARDPAQGRWVLLLLRHHLVGDHTSAEVLHAEIQAHLLGRADGLPAPLPFRGYVAQARLGTGPAAHEAFFRELLGGISQPTAPFGLLDVLGDG